MKKKLLNSIIAVLAFYSLSFAQASSLPWSYTITASSHTILVPGNGIFTINNQPLVPGDIVGVFYDSLGTLACGGYSELTGVNIAVSAWGEDMITGGNNGFINNEAFKWKIFRASDGQVFDAEASYQSVGFFNGGFFANNGMSGVATLTAILESDPVLPWTFTNTGNNHTILIPGLADIQVNNQALLVGDYIGVFYDSLGIQACGGYAMITGVNTALTAWGVDPTTGGNNGFANNEPFNWKIWRASDGMIFNATAIFNTISFPNAGNYLVNGMSGIVSITGITGVDLAVGNLIEPADPCSGLTSSEIVAFQIQNLGTANVDSFHIAFSIDNGATMYYDTISQVILVGESYTYYSTVTFDFATSGSYSLLVNIETEDDLNLSNNTNILAINNFPPTVLDFGNMDTAYCSSSDPIILNAQPAGGNYTAPGLPILTINNNPVVFFPQAGSYDITYSHTDANGCLSTIVQGFTVESSPSLNLPPTALFCEGSNVAISAPSGFFSYEWSNGSTDAEILLDQPGFYHLTVTSSNLCSASDSIQIIELPTPNLVFVGSGSFCEGESLNFGVQAVPSAIYSWSNGSVNNQISVSEGGIYTITITLNGCSVIDQIEITENPLPVIDLGNDIFSCEGVNETLDAGSFSTYLWNTGSTSSTIEVSENGTYSVTVSDQNACANSDEINADFYPLPIVDFSFSYVDQMTVSFTSQTSFADFYAWTFGDGSSSIEQNPTHTYVAGGSYLVLLEVGNECGSSEISYEVVVSLSIEGGFDDMIRLMPNPVIQDLTIEFGTSLPETGIRVFSIDGKLIYNQLHESGIQRAVLPMYDLPSGFYLIEIQSNNQSSLLKVIKQ